MTETVIRSMLNALTLDIKEQDSMKHIDYNLYIQGKEYSYCKELIEYKICIKLYSILQTTKI